MQAQMTHLVSVGQQGHCYSSRFSVLALSLDLLGCLGTLGFSVIPIIYNIHEPRIIVNLVMFGIFLFMVYAAIRDFGTLITLDGESIIKTTPFGVQTFKLTEVNAVSMEDYYWTLARLFGDDRHVLTVQFEQMRGGKRLMAAIINQLRDAQPGVQVSPRLLKLAARYVLEGRA